MHRQYAESWGADIDDVQATPVTQAYIDLLMQVAEDHDSVSGSPGIHA
jgi:thiaminase